MNKNYYAILIRISLFSASMKPVRAKKHLGQHFLKDKNIAKKIADSLSFGDLYNKVLEIGPGMGVLTQYLVEQNKQITVVELDETENPAALAAPPEALITATLSTSN